MNLAVSAYRACGECCLDREWSNGGIVTVRGKSAVRGVKPAALPLRHDLRMTLRLRGVESQTICSLYMGFTGVKRG